MSFLKQLLGAKPSREEFVEMMARALRRRGSQNVERAGKEFALTIGTGKQTVYLHNAYSDYCIAAKDRRAAVLEEFAAGATEIPVLPGVPEKFAEAKRNLMPAIRDAAYFGQFALQRRLKGERSEFVTQPMVGGLSSRWRTTRSATSCC